MTADVSAAPPGAVDVQMADATSEPVQVIQTETPTPSPLPVPIAISIKTETSHTPGQDTIMADSPSTDAPKPSQTPTKDKEETCPACGTQPKKHKSSRTTHWVECERCGGWYHWDCVNAKGEVLSLVDKWYCGPCLGSDPELKITYKPPARKSTRKRTNPHPAASASSPSSEPAWKKFIATKPIASDKFKRMQGSDVHSGWLLHDESAMREPVVIEDPRGLGMRMPGWKDGEEGCNAEPRFGVEDVARVVGPDTPVEVIDVATQSNSPSWDLKKWTEYYTSPPAQRDKIRNVISLEISGTPLAAQVSPPNLVKEIDWFQMFWPANKRGKGLYPKVQLYCLMSVEDCWTDMHVDFAGSSVFYHVLRGSKVFYFIRPTKANLTAYEKWCGSEMQSSTWLGDLVDEVVKVELQEGHTMFIPTGWIHAVYTPTDSLVFGGNFLHSYNIATQLRVRDIEIKTRVPKKFRFPLFQRMCWYVCDGYNAKLKAKEELPPRVLTELKSLSEFVLSEARLMESPNASTERKEAKDMVPHEKVADPSALAREFRWRLRVALGAGSDDEGARKAVSVNKTKKPPPVAVNGKKRKRGGPGGGGGGEDGGESAEESDARSIFRNFTPRPWGVVHKDEGKVAAEDGQTVPEDVAKALGVVADRGERRTMERRTDTVVKMRQVPVDGGGMAVEREIITRVRETWKPSSS